MRHHQGGATEGWEIDREHLRAILAAPAPPRDPPLTREQQVKLLVACYRLNESLVLGRKRVTSTQHLGLLLETGQVQRGEDCDLVKEALNRLGK